MERLGCSQLADFGDAGVLAAFRARDVELVVQDVCRRVLEERRPQETTFSQPLADDKQSDWQPIGELNEEQEKERLKSPVYMGKISGFEGIKTKGKR